MDPVLLCYDWAPGFDFALLEIVPHTCHVRPDGENYEAFRLRYEAQAEGAQHSMAALLEYPRARYPGALVIHDEVIFEGPVEEAAALTDAAQQRVSDVIRQWHKGAGFGLRFSVDAEPARDWKRDS